MKALITPLACLLLAPLSAQTIEYGHLGPFGVSTDMYRMTAPAALPELAGGAGQSWDLSGLTLQNIGTMNFTYAAGTTYADDFPQANWVWVHNATGVGSAYYYIEITTDGMDLWDRNVGLPNAVVYLDPVRIMKFPLELGESFTDEYSTTNGVNYKHWTYTGNGTVTLPIGTVTDVALVVSEEGDIAFWNPEPLYPVMIADATSAMFYLQNNVGIHGPELPSLAVWPNPCRDILHLPTRVRHGQWKVMDMQGRLLLEGMVNGQAGAVDVAGLAPGGYMLLLEADGTRTPVSFVKE